MVSIVLLDILRVWIGVTHAVSVQQDFLLHLHVQAQLTLYVLSVQLALTALTSPPGPSVLQGISVSKELQPSPLAL